MLSNLSVRDHDLTVVTVAGALIFIGLLAIYSATQASMEAATQVKFVRQLIWVLVAILVFLMTVFSPLRFFRENAYLLYAFSLCLLVAVLFMGSGSAARRWLTIGPVWIQPAEFAKVAVILALARYLSQDNRKINNFSDIAIAVAIVAVPLMLIMRQPDLGSALVFLALILPVLHWAGLSPVILFLFLAPLLSLVCAFNYYTFLFAMLFICLMLFLFRRGMVFFLTNFILNVGVGILTPIIWDLLKDYQKNRILTFLGIVNDPHGLGYQVIQSKVAIGSGGLLGKGFLAGTQTHLRFLPEQHTDFIFCVIAEELGFVGAFLTLLLFLFLIYKGLSIASNVRGQFASLIVFGGTILFLFQVLVNVGMTVGIMPVTGLPLPFLSYGGSSLLANVAIVGLFVNASRKRSRYI